MALAKNQGFEPVDGGDMARFIVTAGSYRPKTTLKVSGTLRKPIIRYTYKTD